MKKILRNGLLLLILVLVVYNIVCIIITHDIMIRTEAVIKGNEVILDTSDPLYGFSKGCFSGNTEVKGSAYRIFTYCGKKGGYIYILYWQQFRDDEGTLLLNEKGFCAKLYMEKIEGKWELTSIHRTP